MESEERPEALPLLTVTNSNDPGRQIWRVNQDIRPRSMALPQKEWISVSSHKPKSVSQANPTRQWRSSANMKKEERRKNTPLMKQREPVDASVNHCRRGTVVAEGSSASPVKQNYSSIRHLLNSLHKDDVDEEPVVQKVRFGQIEGVESESPKEETDVTRGEESSVSNGKESLEEWKSRRRSKVLLSSSLEARPKKFEEAEKVNHKKQPEALFPITEFLFACTNSEVYLLAGEEAALVYPLL